MTEQTGPVAAAASLTPEQAKGALAVKFADPAFRQAADIKGSPQWNERQNLQAAMDGVSREAWDISRQTGAAPKAAATVPQPSPAAPVLREWVNSYTPPTPEQLAADEAALADLYAKSVPAHPGAYPDLVIRDAPQLTADDQQAWREAAHKEAYAPTEAQELAIALTNAIQGKPDPAATARLGKLSDPEYRQVLAFAQQEAQRLRAYPWLAAAFDRLARDKVDHDGLLERLARRGARQASRGR
jgi:hypothetical protein